MDKLKVITILLVVVGVGWYGLTIEEAETNQVLSERIEITSVVDITATPTIEPTATPSPTLVPTTASTPTPKKIVITPTPTIVPTPTNTPGPTATPTPIPNITAPADLEPLFLEFSAKYNVSSNMLKKIADCESHFNTAVVSKNGLYAGMFQFAASTWISNRNAMGQNPDLGLRHGARESIETAAYVLSKAGPGAWPACSK